MDLVKKYVLRLPQGIVTVEKDELVAKVKEILKDHPSEHMNAYRVWYEGFEGCGMPGTDVYDVIVETMQLHDRRLEGHWPHAHGEVWRHRPHLPESPLCHRTEAADAPGGPVEMLLHQFHAGKHYQGPDGRVFWIPVIEDFDMRCFERKDGKYVGTMVEIDPKSDYARQMIEVK